MGGSTDVVEISAPCCATTVARVWFGGCCAQGLTGSDVASGESEAR
jgi:hypothetical protein